MLSLFDCIASRVITCQWDYGYTGYINNSEILSPSFSVNGYLGVFCVS